MLLGRAPQIEKCAPPGGAHDLAHRGTREGSNLFEVDIQITSKNGPHGQNSAPAGGNCSQDYGWAAMRQGRLHLVADTKNLPREFASLTQFDPDAKHLSEILRRGDAALKVLLAAAAVIALPAIAEPKMFETPGVYFGVEGGLNWMFNTTILGQNVSPQTGCRGAGRQVRLRLHRSASRKSKAYRQNAG